VFISPSVVLPDKCITWPTAGILDFSAILFFVACIAIPNTNLHANNGNLGFSNYPDIIFCYALTHTNMHAKFQMNPSMLAESKLDKNVHCFMPKQHPGGRF
jgi:hypothetical protein